MRALPFLLLLACSPALPEPYVVFDLRVVAMVAEPPEVPPGGTSMVTTYFFDPDSDERETTAFTYTCVEPDDVDCLILKETPQVQTDPVTTTRLATDLYAVTYPVTIPADIYNSEDVLAQAYGTEQLSLVRGDNGLRFIDGFKRVKVSPPMAFLPPNRNPVFDGFRITEDGVELGSAANLDVLNRGTTYLFTPRFDPATLQQYAVIDFEGQVQMFTEEASFSWSCSPDCNINQRVTYNEDGVEVRPPFDGVPTNRFSIQVVMRDGRGGEALYTRTFTLVPAVRVP